MRLRIPKIALLLLLIACLALTGCEFLVGAAFEIIFDLDDDDDEYCYFCGSYCCTCEEDHPERKRLIKDPRPGDTHKLRS